MQGVNSCYYVNSNLHWRSHEGRTKRAHHPHLAGHHVQDAHPAVGGLHLHRQRGLTLPLARDLTPIGVRANCILPGLIDTPIYGSGPQSDEFKARLGQGVLFPKRLGYSEEFATLAVELLSNSYMNAESIRLDAGIRMQPK